MSTSSLIGTFPLKSILKKEKDPIKDVQNSETKTEVKTNKFFQKKLRNSLKRLSFKKTSYKESTSLDLKPAINIEKKPQKKVTFELDKMKPMAPKEKIPLKESDYLKMKPVVSVITIKMLEQKIQQLDKKQERHFKGNHSYYQYMRSPKEEYQKIWECTPLKK